MNLYRITFESESILCTAVVIADTESNAWKLVRHRLLDDARETAPDTADEIYQEEPIIRQMASFDFDGPNEIREYTCRF